MIKVAYHRHKGTDSSRVEFLDINKKKHVESFSLNGFNLAGTAQVIGSAIATNETNYGVVFIAPWDCTLTDSLESHGTAGTDAGTVGLNLERLTNGQKLDGGTEMLSPDFDLKGTANLFFVGVGTTIVESRQLKRGERIALKDKGTLTSVAGVAVTIELQY